MPSSTQQVPNGSLCAQTAIKITKCQNHKMSKSFALHTENILTRTFQDLPRPREGLSRPVSASNGRPEIRKVPLIQGSLSEGPVEDRPTRRPPAVGSYSPVRSLRAPPPRRWQRGSQNGAVGGMQPALCRVVTSALGGRGPPTGLSSTGKCDEEPCKEDSPDSRTSV